MTRERKLTGKCTGKAISKSIIYLKKTVVTQSPSRQRSLMMTKKKKILSKNNHCLQK